MVHGGLHPRRAGHGSGKSLWAPGKKNNEGRSDTPPSPGFGPAPRGSKGADPGGGVLPENKNPPPPPPLALPFKTPPYCRPWRGAGRGEGTPLLLSVYPTPQHPPPPGAAQPSPPPGGPPAPPPPGHPGPTNPAPPPRPPPPRRPHRIGPASRLPRGPPRAPPPPPPRGWPPPSGFFGPPYTFRAEKTPPVVRVAPATPARGVSNGQVVPHQSEIGVDRRGYSPPKPPPPGPGRKNEPVWRPDRLADRLA